jgi:hypothetical protein
LTTRHDKLHFARKFQSNCAVTAWHNFCKKGNAAQAQPNSNKRTHQHDTRTKKFIFNPIFP